MREGAVVEVWKKGKGEGERGILLEGEMGKCSINKLVGKKPLSHRLEGGG